MDLRFKIFLHNLSHILLPFLILVLILTLSPDLNAFRLYLVILAGALSPDLDHLKVFQEYKFKSFWHFFIYSIESDRYRKTLLIFHNVPAILILSLLLPICFWLNIWLGIFFLSFFSHLILDLLYDFYSFKKFTHWKIRRRI
jgi:hypothetical protein